MTNRRFRFSLRTAFVALTIMVPLFLFCADRYRKQRVVNTFVQNGATVTFHSSAIPFLKHIKRVILADVCAIYCKTATDEDLEGIGSLPRLNSLDLSGSTVGQNGLASLATCTELRRLELRECPNINEDCVENLAKIPRLNSLDIRETPLSTSANSSIGEIESLKTLTISSHQTSYLYTTTLRSFDNDFINSIAHLEVAFDGYTCLTRITDETLSWLENVDFSRVTTLHIHHSVISKSGAQSLCKLRVKELKLDQCTLTETARETLSNSTTPALINDGYALGRKKWRPL